MEKLNRTLIIFDLTADRNGIAYRKVFRALQPVAIQRIVGIFANDHRQANIAVSTDFFNVSNRSRKRNVGHRFAVGKRVSRFQNVQSGRRRFRRRRIAARGIVRGDDGGNNRAAVCNARRSVHSRRCRFSKQEPCKFGIVNEYVSRARDGLYGVVSAHFPRVNGVFLHPFQKDVHAFHNAAFAPHIARVAPTRIDVQNDSCTVAAKVCALAVRIVVAAAFTVCRVPAGAVFALGGGANHHNVVFVAPAQPLAVRPSMLFIPSRVLVFPGRPDFRA